MSSAASSPDAEAARLLRAGHPAQALPLAERAVATKRVCSAALDAKLAEYNALLRGPIAAYDQAAYAAGAPTLGAGGPITVGTVPRID